MSSKYKEMPNHKGYNSAVKSKCDYCQNIFWESKNSYNKNKRHFCNMKCYSSFCKEFLTKEEHNRYGTGESLEIKIKKMKCRSTFNHYLRDKSIKRKPCIVCGNPKSEGHHKDYNKPKDVIWFCFKHHRAISESPELLNQKG